MLGIVAVGSLTRRRWGTKGVDEGDGGHSPPYGTIGERLDSCSLLSQGQASQE